LALAAEFAAVLRFGGCDHLPDGFLGGWLVSWSRSFSNSRAAAISL